MRDRVCEAAHHDRASTTSVVVPFAQLAEAVVAPALGGPVRQQRTRMRCARRDRDRGAREAAHRHRRRRVGRGAVAQLTVAVVAPAFGGPVRQQRARMANAGRDRDRVGQAAHHHRRRRVGGGAVAQLTVAVVAPAFGGPVRQQRTRMEPAGRDRDRGGRGRSPTTGRRRVRSWCRSPTGRRRCRPSTWRCRSPTAHTNGRRPPRSRPRCVRPLTATGVDESVGGAVPQLTVGVVAPALGGAVRQQRTRMVAARRDRDRGRSGRSPPPASTRRWWCRCPTGRRRCSPSIWRCRSPTTHTNGRCPR